MHETLFRVKVADQEYPLLYNLLANMEFETHYQDHEIVDDVDDLMDCFTGPQDIEADPEHGIDGDTPEERKRKAKERKKASAFFKRELPWLIATLAKQGLKAAAKAGETDLPEPPTEEQIAQSAWPGQQAAMIIAFYRAFTYGRLVTHQKGENKAVDVVLAQLEAKNAEGAAD